MSDKNLGSKKLVLFLTYLKIGAFTFGGGYAMITLLENEFCQKKKWLEKEEFSDMVAIAESTPGPAAINFATYIGYKIAGFTGALVATVAICIPSIIIIYLIALAYDAYMANTYVANAFWGIRICVVYLIGSVGIGMIRDMKKTTMNVAVMVASLFIIIASTLMAVNCSTVFLMLGCGMLGVIIYGISTLRKRSGK